MNTIPDDNPGFGLDEAAKPENVKAPCADNINLCVGPQRLSLPTLGLSVYIPFGWIAGMDQGELYGIEPVENNDMDDDSRIYVTKITGSFDTVQHHMATFVDLENFTLEPASPLMVELKLASARFNVTGHAFFQHAWASAVSVSDNQNILFTALASNVISGQLKTVTHDLAGSVKTLSTPVLPFNNSTHNRKDITEPA